MFWDFFMSMGSWFHHLGATLLKALLANVFLFVNDDQLME